MKHKRKTTTKLIYCIILIAFQFVFYANATNWYVDNVASGSNDGTSWTNAWQRFADIQWASIQPGDTIFISGGETEKTYNEQLNIQASGVEGSPIAIKVGQTSPHNGNVIITSDDSFGGLRIYFGSYITVDGNVNGERKLKIYNCSQAGIVVDEPRRVNLTYLNIYENGGDHSWNNHGLRIRIDYYTDLNNKPYLDVSNCHFKENWQDAISGGTGHQVALGFGYVKIHHNIFENTADDGIEISIGGVDIFNNEFFGTYYDGGHGHPDAIAFIGGEYYRVYNNKFHDIVNGNALIYFEYSGSRPERSVRHVYIYNNLLYESEIRFGRVTKFAFCDDCSPLPNYDVGSYIPGMNLTTSKNLIKHLEENGYLDVHGFIQPAFYSLSGASEMLLDREYEDYRQEIYDIVVNHYDDGSALRGLGFAPVVSGPNSVIENVVIANNVIVNIPNHGLSVGFNGFDPENIKNVTVANNIVHNCPSNPNMQSSVMFVDFKDDSLLGSHGSGAEVIFDNNIISAGDEGTTTINYLRNYGDPPFYLTYDQLVNTYGLNIHGANIDPSLDSEYKPDDETDPTVDAGLDLGEYFDFDIDGISRPQGSAWDIGAYEYSTETNIFTASTENKEIFHIYPNPFTYTATIEYTLPEGSDVEIILYDITGRKVQVLYEGHEEAGEHTLDINSYDMAAGTYFCKLKTGDYEAVKECIIIK